MGWLQSMGVRHGNQGGMKERIRCPLGPCGRHDQRAVRGELPNSLTEEIVPPVHDWHEAERPHEWHEAGPTDACWMQRAGVNRDEQRGTVLIFMISLGK
jgi:hypothetical protein